MKKIISLFIGLIICIGVLAGCGQKQTGPGSAEVDVTKVRQDLVGTWSQITDDGSPSLPEMGIPSGFIFYVDGTGVDTFWNMTFSYTADGERMHIAYDDALGEDWDYEYEIKGDVLYLTRDAEDATQMIYERVKEEPESVPTEETPAVVAPAEGVPAEGTPAEGTPAEGVPAEGTPAEGTPAEGAPAEQAPAPEMG